MVRKWWPPRWLTPMIILQNYCWQCPCPQSEPLMSPTSTRDPPILAGRSGSFEVTIFFPWFLVCTRPCVCPPRVEFLFPPVLWNSCSQSPLAFKARFSGGFSSSCQTRQTVEPDMGVRTFIPVGELLWYSYFSVCGLPTPVCMGFDFYCDFTPPTISL